jgi:hypothetical protein
MIFHGQTLRLRYLAHPTSNIQAVKVASCIAVLPTSSRAQAVCNQNCFFFHTGQNGYRFNVIASVPSFIIVRSSRLELVLGMLIQKIVLKVGLQNLNK